MPVREGAVDSDGVAIHYLDWGGDGPPLVLIHATGFLGAIWRPIAERLAGRFRIVSVRSPSAWPMRTCSRTRLVSDNSSTRVS